MREVIARSHLQLSTVKRSCVGKRGRSSLGSHQRASIRKTST
ncbi:hypothetical protein GQ600_26351 [Phytophthora cactorum]|nr:hypothetical protein GQ600_26351 [Phytophthora cactorum]